MSGCDPQSGRASRSSIPAALVVAWMMVEAVACTRATDAPLAAPATETPKAAASLESSTPAPSPNLVRRRPPQGSYFTVWVDFPPRLEVGRLHEGIVTVQPIDPWHVNREVAARIMWQNDARVALGEPESIAMAPAKETQSDDTLRFPLAVIPQVAGELIVSGELEAGFCRDAACIPLRRRFQITLQAQGSAFFSNESQP